MKNQKGFTFVELVVVIAIIGMITAIASPLIDNPLNKRQNANDQNMLSLLNNVTKNYKLYEAPGADAFYGRDTNAERLSLLIEKDYLNQSIEPQQEGMTFNWNVEDQRWEMMGDRADEDPSNTSDSSESQDNAVDETDHDNDSSVNDQSDNDGTEDSEPVVYSEWDKTTIYDFPEHVTYNGAVYEARWWTQNDKPGKKNSPWQEITDEWRSFNIYLEGDIVIYNGVRYKAKWWTQNDKPGKKNSPWEETSET